MSDSISKLRANQYNQRIARDKNFKRDYGKIRNFMEGLAAVILTRAVLFQPLERV